MGIRRLAIILAIALPLLGMTSGAEEKTQQAAAPAAAPADATKPSPDGGNAVVEQILRDKEDLITGRRFSYDPGGRRDPFRSLLENVSRFKGPRPKGIAGMLVGEVDLVGTVKDRQGNIAFFRGSDNKGYFLRVGDELYDGRIIEIDPAAGTVSFRQRVDDPRQIKPYRDVVKRLSPLTEEEAQ